MDLLAPKLSPSQEDEEMLEYINKNVAEERSNLDRPFTKEQYFLAISNLKNNKSACFDPKNK